MRSALLCVFFTLIIHKEGTARGDDFRPTPIPLDEWHPTKRDAGTLQEIIKTESPPSVTAVPAHYWEDALRHSVYLTLVRDKIDQLITKGDVIAPSSIDQATSKGIDDHDLWEKIKKAPFDRRQYEEGNSSDVAIVAKGRLLENKEGYQFAEDDKSQNNCSEDRCAEGVKAFWSVKRVRQREQETNGKYHYELTFSVVSQIPKRQPKPYENPIRTFTVRETSPEKTVDYPQENRKHETYARPQRAIWFHKNIVPIPPHTRRQPTKGLDRIFSSIFSDSDDSSHDQPQPKYRSNSAPFQAYQLSKVGHAGPPVDYHQPPKSFPYPYKQSQPYKYIRPPLQAPPAGPLQHHYLDYESSPIINGNPYPHDSRVSPTQAVKTTRPAILPTPVPLTSPQKEQTFNLGTPMFIDSAESSENITRYEINNSYKSPTRVKSTSSKVNYFPEHIRPPVYNAPPGVFVTMDKKPFKPLPPLKHVQHNSKPHRVNKPADFRPSPQVHDSQSPDSDPLFDTAFRPIAMNYADSSTTETIALVHTKKGNNKQRKTSSNPKKPMKKHHNVKASKPVTTATPDIITAQTIPDGDEDTLDWANVLGAFTKTTPMVIQTERIVPVETTTSYLLNTSATLIWKNPSTVTVPTETTTPTTTTTTTVRPKKRTRPPPKFTKQDKFKKHKRVTTTSPTEMTEHQEKATVRRPTTESTPVLNATTKSVKSLWDSKNKTHATSTTTTTTRPTTMSTTRPTTTKIVIPIKQASTAYTTTFAPQMSTTPKIEIKQPPTHIPRNINRFRQSTLFYKGTSVKHDKWSFRSNSSSQPQNYRRTSNFQGYVTSTTHATTPKEQQLKQDNISHIDVSSTTEKIGSSKKGENFSNNSVHFSEENAKNETENSQEESEFIFEQSTIATDTNNEVLNTSTIETTPQFDSKNKTKCKKKKLTTTTIETPTETFTEQSTPKTYTEDSTDDIFEQLFGFNFNSETTTTKDTSPELLEGESSHHASFLKADDGLTDFMADFNKKHNHSDPTNDDYDEDEDDYDDDDDIPNTDDESSEDENEDPQTEDNDKESSRDSRYESYDMGRPYSFLELMAME